MHLIVAADVFKVGRGPIWALFCCVSQNFLDCCPANTILSPVDVFFAALLALPSLHRKRLQASTNDCHGKPFFPFFPDLLLSSFHVCWLLLGAFALFGAHSSACAKMPHPEFLQCSAFAREKNTTKGISVEASMGGTAMHLLLDQ